MKEKKLINIRALAILIVVLGHSIIIYSSKWTLYDTVNTVHSLDLLKKIINCYQMQLFFSLSGYLFFYSCLKNKEYFTFVIDKIKRLLIPFFAVAALYVLPLKMLLKVPGFEGNYFRLFFNSFIKLNNTGHLWFLITLFIIFIIFFTLSKIIKLNKKDLKYKIVDIVILILALIISLNTSYFKSIIPDTGLYRVFEYSFWFYLGFCLNKYFSLGKKNDSYKKLYVPYLCLLTGALMIYRITHETQVIKVITTICVIILPYIIMPSKTNRVTEYLDRNSMGMFLFHSPLVYISFIYYPNINPILMVFINFICFGFLSSLITELIRKTPLKIIIGEK